MLPVKYLSYIALFGLQVIGAVRSTLTDLKLAIDGTIIMSENLRDALDCMFDARIPAAWQKVRSYMTAYELGVIG